MWTAIEQYKAENADVADMPNKWQVEEEHIEIIVSAKYKEYSF